MKSILDPGFKYISSDNTDLRKSFRRIRREMRAGGAAVPSAPKTPPSFRLVSEKRRVA